MVVKGETPLSGVVSLNMLPFGVEDFLLLGQVAICLTVFGVVVSSDLLSFTMNDLSK